MKEIDSMKISHVLLRTILSSSLFFGAWAIAGAQDTASLADNTKVNQRDRNPSEPQRTNRKILSLIAK
jgi:hypothetical protein